MDAAGVELEALAKREPAAEILSEAEGPVKANLVEAAGVEPASEKVTGQETTCLFTFMPRRCIPRQLAFFFVLRTMSSKIGTLAPPPRRQRAPQSIN